MLLSLHKPRRPKVVVGAAPRLLLLQGSDETEPQVLDETDPEVSHPAAAPETLLDDVACNDAWRRNAAAANLARVRAQSLHAELEIALDSKCGSPPLPCDALDVTWLDYCDRHAANGQIWALAEVCRRSRRGDREIMVSWVGRSAEVHLERTTTTTTTREHPLLKSALLEKANKSATKTRRRVMIADVRPLMLKNPGVAVVGSSDTIAAALNDAICGLRTGSLALDAAHQMARDVFVAGGNGVHDESPELTAAKQLFADELRIATLDSWNDGVGPRSTPPPPQSPRLVLHAVHALTIAEILDSELLASASAFMSRWARPLDDACKDPSFKCESEIADSQGETRDDEPHVLCGTRHWKVVFKPAIYGIAHRLDAQTSGPLLVANTYWGWAWLQLQFRSQRVQKRYVCLCYGRMTKSPGSLISRPIAREYVRGRIGKRGVVRKWGARAVTEIVAVAHLRGPKYFRRRRSERGAVTYYSDQRDAGPQHLECDDIYSLVEVRLWTGRLHQIRVHMSSEGFALVADFTYGGARARWCPRIFLHCMCLGFVGDQDSDYVTITCQLPNDLRRGLRSVFSMPFGAEDVLAGADLGTIVEFRPVILTLENGETTAYAADLRSLSAEYPLTKI
ncbi:hypothetical protein CTAYLR_001789 [Chrysophaeum taylorii]|uniref:Pseudouridine synthase RsuA/RluA-like domain-containing protein n=1 Tax=Chrysophaeum taylorii TaxID=2483200 RepID=A0AAD7UFG9_9STRA|nr:hypothetical protein CTAYLR_001789 [Chrysophaeum taylorii]